MSGLMNLVPGVARGNWSDVRASLDQHVYTDTCALLLQRYQSPVRCALVPCMRGRCHNVPRSTQPRTKEQREQELQKIQQYRDLEQKVRQRTTSSQYDETTFHLSSELLRINPEHYTIWNVRRRCLKYSILSTSRRGEYKSFPTQRSPYLQAQDKKWNDTSKTQRDIRSHVAVVDCSDSQSGDEETIRSELMFTVPLLMEFPKCYWIWKYRLWILHQAIERLSPTATRAVWQEELALVGKMLKKDRRNFHAWGYRRHVVEQLESSSLRGTSMVEAEFAYTTKMIGGDLSNFSAWHNRSQLIPRLLNERSADVNARRLFLDEGIVQCIEPQPFVFPKLTDSTTRSEILTVHEALNVGPEDQSLWYYHQYLVHAIIGADGQGLIVHNLSAQDRQRYLEAEVNFMKDLLQDYLDVKWIYEALIECTLAANTLRTDAQQQMKQPQVADWLEKLRELDTKRSGRWDELEKQMQIN
ncbi:hypothetical protein C2857_001492 [Epichloe festucae Fl1]|uniref:Geranylgeranyl transferase type-2 subunit alpha n=1 Tax=Epichloe festucae (strain Fl1) TaxID=877507 RepID=A0A7S9KUN3_EPIFF|nr:hypothetical protein C2857_001492 [Epichloe festucae Fl1]